MITLENASEQASTPGILTQSPCFWLLS